MFDRLHYSINMLLYELATKKKKCLWLDFSWYSLYCSDLEFAPQYVWNKPVPRFCFIIFCQFLCFWILVTANLFLFFLHHIWKHCHILTFHFWVWLFAHLWYSLTVCFPWLLASSIHSFFCGHLLPNLHGFPVSCCLFSSTPITYTVPSWHTNF